MKKVDPPKMAISGGDIILVEQKHACMLSATAPFLNALYDFTGAICQCNSVLQNARVCTLTYNSLLTLIAPNQSRDAIASKKRFDK